ncbi:Glycosyltransferase [hydrothermal vent metagenome]|uniref:Glycosyltransferase n=1 Tax=hydrothermal vent metagenome TaxID=652676 RepID=A0A3B0YK70_9ZZZZ
MTTNSNSTNPSRIVIFCKAPVAGSCKTRLAQHYGHRGAAGIARRLLNLTVDKIMCDIDINAGTDIELCCAPTLAHPAFLSLKKRYFNQSLLFNVQSNGGLGERMFHAAKRVLKYRSHVIILGTDCPAMTSRYIMDALEKLKAGCDAVIGPASDGGYVLIGLRVADIRLFQNVSWGTSRVLQQTLRNCQRLNIKPVILSELNDIDYASDWLAWKHDCIREN